MKKLGVFFSIVSILIVGCSKSPPPPSTFHEANQEFLTEVNATLKYPAQLQTMNETIWIYIPIEETLLSAKATKKFAIFSFGQTERESSVAQSSKDSIYYLDSKFKKGEFQIAYDISPLKSYPPPTVPGYETSVSDIYRTMQQTILQSVAKYYFEIKDAPPKFIVLVITDVIAGIEVETIMYLEDLKRIMSLAAPLPPSESNQRFISEFRGNEEAIGNKKGSHLKVRDITMGEFLSKQIKQRITFRYTQSSFPPAGEKQDVILETIQNTVTIYEFNDYSSIMLHDLATGQESQINKSKL